MILQWPKQQVYGSATT